MTDLSLQPNVVLQGGRVMRVVCVLGSDQLHGFCWCGAIRVAEDPIEMWDWLIAHPDGHARDAELSPSPEPVPPRASMPSS